MERVQKEVRRQPVAGGGRENGPSNCRHLEEGACCAVRGPKWLGWDRNERVMGVEVRAIARIPESVGFLDLILTAVELGMLRFAL